jgi:membrane protein
MAADVEMRQHAVADAEKAAQDAKLMWVLHRLAPSLRYLFTTEAHVYAYSIAANALLTFFPFALLMLTICRRWLHWEGAYQVIVQMLRANLPEGGDFVIRNLAALVQGRGRIQVISILALFFTSSGIFLPLEVALNKINGVERNRSFLRNLAMSFCLAVCAGMMVLFSIILTASAQWAVGFAFGWFPYAKAVLFRGTVEAFSLPLLISLYVIVYYVAPNGRPPMRRVFPAAALAGLLTAAAKFLYLVTLPLFRFREVYGPFSLSVTLLFWAFVGALILLFGAHVSAQGLWDRIPAREPALSTPTFSEVDGQRTRIFRGI